ncbi:MAG: nucleoside triphosphate pyrophosphohydrolase [Gammaproteobacteria bacterium]|nr:nucleoside triphosphate pyrophosphohydrolase [Gammaproteobacteria bacterium]
MNEIKKLLEVMSQLRDPEAGCPWDLAQDYRSIAPCTIEEAYEVVDAIERGEMDDLCDELGDLLFQVVFYAQIAKEEGRFDFARVVETITEKLIRRHPHVFDDDVDGAQIPEGDHGAMWEKIKAGERRKKSVAVSDQSALNGVAMTLPALTRAVKLQKRAAHVGFDWPEIGQVLNKVQEELDEVREVLEQKQGDLRMRHEVGDLLQAVSNLARHASIDPECALREANRRFEHRFSLVEAQCADLGVMPQDVNLLALDAMWLKAKLAE